MNSSIKIVKRKQNEKYKPDRDSNELQTSEIEKSTDQSKREIASTIKGWIADLQQRKRAQDHSFPPFTVATASQNS